MKLEVILIPIITTAFTTAVLYLKESKQNKQKIKRTITEQKLTELYNKLFSLSLIYTDKLEQSFYKVPKGMFELGGELVPEEDKMMIKNKELWDDVIKQIRELIHSKLHLLEEDDLRNWHQIELMELEESMEDKVNIYKYKKLEMFLVDVSLRYHQLYKQYHLK